MPQSTHDPGPSTLLPLLRGSGRLWLSCVVQIILGEPVWSLPFLKQPKKRLETSALGLLLQLVLLSSLWQSLVLPLNQV